MHRLRDLVFGPGRAVAVLSFTEVLCWGILIYPPVLIMPQLAADRGWSLAFGMAGFSIGLVTSGMLSPTVGHLIDRHGGNSVMSLGALIGALGLVFLTFAEQRPFYLACWILIGTGMASTLYDPAFATLTRIFGSSARRQITFVTFAGGFASTVGWPATQLLLETVGWRGRRERCLGGADAPRRLAVHPARGGVCVACLHPVRRDLEPAGDAAAWRHGCGHRGRHRRAVRAGTGGGAAGGFHARRPHPSALDRARRDRADGVRLCHAVVGRRFARRGCIVRDCLRRGQRRDDDRARRAAAVDVRARRIRPCRRPHRAAGAVRAGLGAVRGGCSLRTLLGSHRAGNGDRRRTAGIGMLSDDPAAAIGAPLKASDIYAGTSFL